MKTPIHLIWDPHLISEIQVAIKAAARTDRPRIVLFQGERNKITQGAFSFAVFPSCFNPPTLAHCEIVKRAVERSEFMRVILLLDLHHADKPLLDATLEDRAIMMRLAFGDIDKTLLGICSHGRFVDKLKALKGDFSPCHSWVFLVGMDTMARVLEPKFYNDPQGELGELFKEAGFWVFEREGAFRDTLRSSISEWIRRGARIELTEMPAGLLTLSSTIVRDRVAKGLPIDSIVPPAVKVFIEETGLYGSSASQVGLYKARKEIIREILECGPVALHKADLKKTAMEMVSSRTLHRVS